MSEVKKNSTNSSKKISAAALRRFAENRRIFNEAVQKAVAENRKLGISDELQFERLS